MHRNLAHLHSKNRLMGAYGSRAKGGRYAMYLPPAVFWSGGLDSNQRPLDPQSKSIGISNPSTCGFVFQSRAICDINRHKRTGIMGAYGYAFLHAHGCQRVAEGCRTFSAHQAPKPMGKYSTSPKIGP